MALVLSLPLNTSSFGSSADPGIFDVRENAGISTATSAGGCCCSQDALCPSLLQGTQAASVLLQLEALLAQLLAGMGLAGRGSGRGPQAWGGSPAAPSLSGSGPAGQYATAGPAGQQALAATGGEGDSVKLARRYLGMNAVDVKGKLPGFTAAGGQTNNCADFVSSILEDTQGLRGHHVNVKELERALQSQGWRQVPASQAGPGDVWISADRGHTEMVTSQGGRTTIGSNNDRPGHQVISERAKDPSSGVYYSK